MEHGECLIQDCMFLDVSQKRYCEGALHQLADILVFDICSPWTVVTEPLAQETYIVRSEIYMDMKGVIVFPLALTEFNEAANKYLNAKLLAESKQIITFGKH